MVSQTRQNQTHFIFVIYVDAKSITLTVFTELYFQKSRNILSKTNKQKTYKKISEEKLYLKLFKFILTKKKYLTYPVRVARAPL